MSSMFHASRRSLGQHDVTSNELPPLDEEGKLILFPKEILEVREQKLRSRTIKEDLVKWKDFPFEGATGEGEQVLQCLGLKLLEEKQYWMGRTVMSPSA